MYIQGETLINISDLILLLEKVYPKYLIESVYKTVTYGIMELVVPH